MARLLTDIDYQRIIQDKNLNQIIEANPSLLLPIEQAAQSKMIGYLDARYLTDKVFTNTTFFSTGATYNANDLVVYSATSYSNSTAYSVGNHVSFSGIIYNCILSTTGGTAPNTGTTVWSGVAFNNSFYYVAKPCPEYDFNTFYNVGDQVFYNGKVYQATQNLNGTVDGQSTNLMLRYPSTTIYAQDDISINSNPVPSANPQNWSMVSAHTISGSYPEDSSKWVAGDNRNQLIVQYLLDIVLFNLYARLNPQNIPQLRFERYCGNNYETGGAIGWLKQVSKGEVSADLPKIILPTGLNIQWGSNPRNTSSY